MPPGPRQPVRVILAVVTTLAIIAVVPNRVLVVVLLLASWWGYYRPLDRREFGLGVLAAVVFLFQNYVTLKAGLFEFRFKDILLMPYYEPFLWSFYFLSMKRFVTGAGRDGIAIDWRSVVGLIVTSLTFSLFGKDPRTLLLASLASTALLFAFFHTADDLAYAGFGLALGFVIELFGVTTGLWFYPAPDFLGMPFWFATMWMSVALLGRRFLIPVSGWLVDRMSPQRA